VPAFFSADAKDCVSRLLIKKPELRLGGGELGGEEVSGFLHGRAHGTMGIVERGVVYLLGWWA
jgi:hypothetical protein